MRLPEKMTFTLPPCDASFMKVKAMLVDENSDNEILLETEQLNVPLSLVSNLAVSFFRAVICVCFLRGMYSRFQCCRIGRDKKSTGLCTFGSDFKTSLEVLKTMFENSFLFVASKQGVGSPRAIRQ